MSLAASDHVKTPYAAETPQELLAEPVTALLGVTDAAAEALKKLGIETVFDLAFSEVFRDARQLVEAAEGSSDGLGRYGRVPGDLVDHGAREKKLTSLQMEPLQTLRGIGPGLASALGPSIGATNIREFGLWPVYDAARSILDDAYGLESVGEADPEQPEDLVPGSGRYPTERVQYTVLVLDTMDDDGAAAQRVEAQPAVRPPERPPGAGDGAAKFAVDGAGVRLEDAGQLDLAALALDSVGFTKPATGALLTYTQSWFAEVLALGQLLHTVALAPGESTRIAMIDWSRRTTASTTEQISESEALTSDLNRTRSISEIVNAVATEAQQGFSQSFGIGSGTQGGTASGGAGSADLSSASGLPIKLAGGSGESTGTGLGFGGAESSSWTTGQRTLSANMAQNVMDQTHQASNSARNRWATIVREVSQSESENISTRTVTNYNHMHALSIEYFEIVQLYRAVVELTKVDKCLFVPMKLIDFTRAGVVDRYKMVIAARGLTPRVRALEFAETDMMIISAPHRSGDWEVAQANADFGEPVGQPSASALELPLTFIQFALSYNEEAPFSSFTLRFSSGETADVQVTSNDPALGAYNGFLIDLGGGTTIDVARQEQAIKDQAAHFSDVVSIQANKKKGSEDWSGNVTIFFRFFVPKSPPAAAASSYVKVTLAIPASDPAPVVFETARTVSGRELRQHVMDNQLYYSQVIWRTLGSASVAQMLSRYTFEGGPVLSQVDPLPVTVAGNYLVFRKHLANTNEAADQWARWLKSRDIVIGERREDLVPLPSGGVFAEAVLGRFNSAEKLDITRFWNWQDSPIPITPPDIASVQAGSRAQPEDLTPGQLSAPVLNIQQPPDEPEPQGLTAILQAIQNGNMFRDMSGLNATIGFAQNAMSRAFDAARDAASQAGQNMKTAADIYKSAFGGSSSTPGVQGTQGRTNGTGGLVGGLSGQGAKLNYGRQKDARDAANGTGQGPSVTGNGASGPATDSGGTTSGSGIPVGGAEQAALENALGSGGGSGLLPDAFRDWVLSNALAQSPQPAAERPDPALLTAIAADVRLKESFDRLVADGWQLRRRNIMTSNSDLDADQRLLLIDDDNEPLEVQLDWTRDAVRRAYQADDDYRRKAVRDKAITVFSTAGLTDLERMAQTYEWAVWFWCYPSVAGNPRGLLDDMMLVLTELNQNGLTDSDGTYYIFAVGRLPRANSTGFKRTYRDDSNQVRHVTASIQASLTLGPAGLALMQSREDPASADFRLNNACAGIAFDLELEITHASDISATLRNKLGDPTETSPWNGPPDGDPV